MTGDLNVCYVAGTVRSRPRTTGRLCVFELETAAPRRRLRLTVRAADLDKTALEALRPGARVYAVGPVGHLRGVDRKGLRYDEVVLEARFVRVLRNGGNEATP